MNEPTSDMWDSLIFGVYNYTKVKDALSQSAGWHSLRISLLGMPSQYKFDKLKEYVTALDNIDPNSHPPAVDIFAQEQKLSIAEYWDRRREVRRILVTNYVYSLRRGGLIP